MFYAILVSRIDIEKKKKKPLKELEKLELPAEIWQE